MKRFRFFLGMLASAMLLGLIVLVILDERNPFLRMLTSTASHVFLLLTAVLGLGVIALYLASLRGK